MKIQKIFAAFATILAFGAAFSGNVSAASYFNSSVENAYSVTPFDEAYSSSYLTDFANGFDVGSGVLSDGTYYYGRNTEKDPNVYIDLYGGAVIDNIKYDVREYLWVADGQTNWMWQRIVGEDPEDGYYTAYYIRASEKTEIYREIHVYQAGTLKSGAPAEVNFNGIMHFSDLDTNEGNRIVQGLNGAWVTRDTALKYSGENKWLGTKMTSDSELQTQLWVQVSGTPAKPIIVTYIAPNARHGNISFSAVVLKYAVKYPDGTSKITEQKVAKYGTFTLPEPTYTGEDADNYEFSGWYNDEALTDPADLHETLISGDQTFYGTFVKTKSKVETEVTGGIITPSCDGLPADEPYTVSFEPNDGYELQSVTVDGEKADAEKFKNEYILMTCILIM